MDGWDGEIGMDIYFVDGEKLMYILYNRYLKV